QHHLGAVAFLGFSLALGVVGCHQPTAKKSPDPSVIRVTPCSLFQGDTQRIAPHLGFMGTACIKVDFQGKELPIKLEYVAWHNGKVQKTHPTSDQSLYGPAEITFSIKEVEQAPRNGLPEGEKQLPGE